MKSNVAVIPALSGLRGFAALLVFVSHSERRDILPKFSGLTMGYMGVMLFFTLSAFLMTYLYLERLPDRQQQTNFWVARFARIYPLHITLLLTGFLACVAGVSEETCPYAIDAETLVKNAAFVGMFNVFWTISVEFQFYLLFVIGWFLGHKFDNAKGFAAAMSAVALFGVFANVHPYPSGSVFKVIQFFAAGIVAGLALQQWDLRRFGKHADGMLGVSLVLFVLSFPAFFEAIAGFSHRGFWSPWILGLCFSLVFFGAFAQGPVSRALGSRVGDLSFAIYLLHIPIMRLVMKTIDDMSFWVKFPVALGATLILSQIVFTYFEAPLRRWVRQRFSVPPGNPVRPRINAAETVS